MEELLRVLVQLPSTGTRASGLGEVPTGSLHLGWLPGSQVPAWLWVG